MLTYPPDQHETDSKTIFFIGSASNSCVINGKKVELYPNGNFCHIVDLKLGKNAFEIELDGQLEKRTVLGVNAVAPKPVAYGAHYDAFPCKENHKRNVLRSIVVSNKQIKIPLNIPPIYQLEKHGDYKYVLDLADIEMDLDWIHYQDEHCSVIIGEVIDAKFPIIFKRPVANVIENWEKDCLILNIEYQEVGFKICIDPGHGGDASGACSPKGVLEKDLNLKCSQLLKKELDELGVETCVTRDDDKAVSLQDRVKCAVEEDCRLMLSIHHNALPDARDPRLERGVSCHYYHEQSKPFANFLLQRLVELTELPYAGLLRQNLHILRETSDCTAVLVELGFLIHPEESELLVNEEHQALVARVMAKAIYNFYVKQGGPA